MNQVRVGIIGLQHLHPRAYMPLFDVCVGAEVVCVCEEDDVLRSSFCNDFGVGGYQSLEAMIAREELDMAAIFLPHSDCAEVGVQCAENGMHLMIEKPIADTSSAVEDVINAARANDVLLTTGYCWRYHPVMQEMKRTVERGVLGEVVSAEARLAAGRVERYLDGHAGWMLEKAKSGGGPMYNLGVHWIDILCYLLSDDIVEVCAHHVDVNAQYDIEDGSAALLKFGSGLVASLNVSYIVPENFPGGRDLHIGLKGTKGAASYSPEYEGEHGSGAEAQVDELEVCSDAGEYEGASVRKFCFQLDPTAGYSGYMGKVYVEEFVDAIRKEKTPAITGGEALKVLKVVEALYDSADKHCWVEVEN